MANTVNKAILVGRLGKEPEIRFTPGGQAVANFSIATDESYKKDGEKVKKTEWHNIVVWGPSVEAFIQPYVHQGDLVYVEGKLQTRSWEAKDNGGTRYTTEVNVSDIRILQSKNSDGGQAAPAATASKGTRGSAPRTAAARPAQTQRQAPAELPEISDEDIPF